MDRYSKLLKENMGRTGFEINHSNFFLVSLLEKRKIKLHKTNLMNLKSFCTAREALMKEENP